ncbi:MAG: pro-sigmaK processing inhibitor BofA family protein [Bacteroidales bacterium]
MVKVLILGPIIAVVLLVIVIFIALKMGKSLGILIVNSVIGLIMLWLINLLPIVNVAINFWSILIVALGGIPGLILLVILDLLKIAF